MIGYAVVLTKNYQPAKNELHSSFFFSHRHL